MNDTYTVQAGASKYYLRVYRHGWRDKPQIEAEVDLLNHLVAERQPVSSPVAKDDGTYLTQIDAPEGTRYAVLFTEAPGRRPAFNTTDCRQFGEIVANLHASMDQQPEDARRFHLDLAHLIDEPLEYIEPYLSHRPREFENLQRTAESLKSDIEGLLTTNMPAYGGCHGDHHGGNVNQDREGRMVVFDFDCYGYGWRAYDLAVFLWQASGPPGLNGKGNADAPSQWKSFLEGYSQVRTLTNDELEATRLFVPIRRIWWMGVQTRLAQTVGRNPWPNLAGLDEDAQRVWFDRNIGLVDDSIDRQLP